MDESEIAEIKEEMNRLTDRLVRIEHNLEKVLDIAQEHSETIFGAHNCIDIEEKIEDLIIDIKAVILDTKTRDKFEDYMKNVDKLNAMINEFKGCVSIARSALAERKWLEAVLKP